MDPRAGVLTRGSVVTSTSSGKEDMQGVRKRLDRLEFLKETSEPRAGGSDEC